jgi:hypothetical protein
VFITSTDYTELLPAYESKPLYNKGRAMLIDEIGFLSKQVHLNHCPNTTGFSITLAYIQIAQGRS